MEDVSSAELREFSASDQTDSARKDNQFGLEQLSKFSTTDWPIRPASSNKS